MRLVSLPKILLTQFILLCASSAFAAPCSEPAVLNGSAHANAPFFECGMGAMDWLSPEPTRLPTHFAGTPMDGLKHCVTFFTPESWWAGNGQPGWETGKFYLPGNDRFVHWRAQSDVELTFDGDRVQVFTHPEVDLNQFHVTWTEGSTNIELNGECLVPEPGLAAGLWLGIMALLAASSSRASSSRMD